MLNEKNSKEAAAFSKTIFGCQRVVDNLLREFFKSPRRVEVRPLEKPTLNACAAREDDLYVIEIHDGAFSRLLETFAACLSQNCIAAVKDRSRLHLWLLNVAIEFLIFHEVGHIVLGHLEYCDTLELIEFRDETPSQKQALDLQALELMADEFAVTAVRFTRFSGHYVDDCGLPEFSDPSIYEHAYLFAIGLLFLVLTPAKDFASLTTTSHPHPEFRNSMTWALLYIDREAPDPELASRVTADLACMPRVLGIPDEAFLGTIWSVDRDKPVPANVLRKMKQIFEQSTFSLQRMRPTMDVYRDEVVCDSPD